jgi:protein-S-isoprenylcysteine O-methyltransferase Ste14
MDPVWMVVGGALVVLGAVGATVTQRRLEAEGRAATAPLWLVPFGILVGAGAAMVRGWDLWASIVVGAILVPVVGAAGRLWEVRRARRRRGR